MNAVKDVGESVRNFNSTIQKITSSVDNGLENNKEKISQVVQWSQVFLEMKEKWKTRKLANQTEDKQLRSKQTERARY